LLRRYGHNRYARALAFEADAGVDSLGVFAGLCEVGCRLHKKTPQAIQVIFLAFPSK
jgi:hypothetical protein